MLFFPMLILFLAMTSHLNRQMDTNNDGVVDAAEFAAAGGSKQEFDERDLNGDGLLDADELNLWAKVTRGTVTRFSSFSSLWNYES